MYECQKIIICSSTVQYAMMYVVGCSCWRFKIRSRWPRPEGVRTAKEVRSSTIHEPVFNSRKEVRCCSDRSKLQRDRYWKVRTYIREKETFLPTTYYYIPLTLVVEKLRPTMHACMHHEKDQHQHQHRHHLLSKQFITFQRQRDYS